MRTFLCLALVIGCAWAVDQFAFNGRYTKEAWQEAKYQSSHLGNEVYYWLKRSGLK